MWCLWLIAAAVFFIIEIATIGFLIFWLGIGSLCAMIASFFTDNILIQTGIFVVVSAILIPLTKPFADKFLNSKAVTTNSYSLINKRGIITKTINSIDDIGLVKIDGEVWSAKCDQNVKLPEGTEVEVLKIEGVKLIVAPLQKTSNLN